MASKDAETPLAAFIRYIAAPKHIELGGKTAAAAPAARSPTSSIGLKAAERPVKSNPYRRILLSVVQSDSKKSFLTEEWGRDQSIMRFNQLCSL